MSDAGLERHQPLATAPVTPLRRCPPALPSGQQRPGPRRQSDRPGGARSRGFNVQLAGAINLARDPRNGRFSSEGPVV